MSLLKPVVVAVLALPFVVACEPTNQGYQPRQPIVYSHAVHAGDLQIPCGYCHYAAERGRHAGIPPIGLCMNCHTQVRKDHPEVVKIREAVESHTPIEWVRVHRLPDHAYFDHSAHVAANVECQTCHGPIEEMGLVSQDAPLTMGWCIDCHRTKGADEAIDRGVPEGLALAANRLTDCAVCHH